jgi:hypothetical protein
MKIDAEILLAEISNSIRFHEHNTNDPHNVGSAVITALLEVENAIKRAMGAPKSEEHKVREFTQEFTGL